MTGVSPFINDADLAWFRSFNQYGFNPACQWCFDRRRPCVGCQSQLNALLPLADAEYHRQFPDGPKPIATFDTTTSEGRARATDFLRKLVGEQGATAIVAATQLEVRA